jgi:hypothetical protein
LLGLIDWSPRPLGAFRPLLGFLCVGLELVRLFRYFFLQIFQRQLSAFLSGLLGCSRQKKKSLTKLAASDEPPSIWHKPMNYSQQ